MGHPAWSASGDFFETCSCDYLCPCLASNLTARPTKGDCAFAMAFRVNRGHFGDASLDGLCFVLAGVSPGPVGEGNWRLGLIVDERADAAQEQAITSIAGGRAGGPLASFAPFITSFLGRAMPDRDCKIARSQRWSSTIRCASAPTRRASSIATATAIATGRCGAS
jgi:hypothetical protein